MGAPIELRFADFEVSVRSGELRRNGVKIKLQEQPFQILVLLLERRGEVVPREELRQKLWAADTFVDFDNGLNIAIKKLRTALGDDADAPRYIETLPRRGYRFIAPVTAYEFRGEDSGDVFDAILPHASTAQDAASRSQPASGMRPELKLVKPEANSSAPIGASASSAASSTQTPTVASRRLRAKLIGMAAIILTFALVAAFGVYKLLARKALTPDTRNMTIRPLTDHGRAIYTSISPDGRLLAYVRRDGERSLRVKEVVAGSEVTVVPAQTGFFANDLTFTPDGNYLYYAHQDPTNSNIVNVYRVPSLGGASRQIVRDVASAVTFSPDGKRMAYLRSLREQGESQLMIANADGSGERAIVRRESQIVGPCSNPSWSPSNNLIALGTLAGDRAASIEVLTPDGQPVRSFSLPLLVGDVAWAPGLSGLFFIGVGKSTGVRPQIWFQPYPSGQPVKVSNDLSIYRSLSITTDGQSLVTTQERGAATIFVADSPPILNDKIDWKLTPISNEQASGYDLSWTPSGKLLQGDETYHVYETAGDGSGRVDLLERDDIAFAPTACGAGDVIVLARILENHQPTVWRLNVSTGELKQLTFGRGEEYPSCTPDGKWVLYQGLLTTDSVGHISKVSIEGGTPVELAHGDVASPSVSPDGKLVVYVRSDGKGASTKRKWVVQRLEDGAIVREFEVPSNDNELTPKQLGWTPDGRGFSFVHNTTGNAQNVYMQPLAGGEAVQLTHFDSEPAMVAAYGWSRDGKKFAITRARYNDTDVVMFSNFR
jgi:Tol biopolymer transport system component/DNA-binding winged helix-turn-helix (wHTH) protein